MRCHPMTGPAPSDPSPSGKTRRSELNTRFLSAVALACCALGATWFGGIPFAALWSLASALVVLEWLTLIAPPATRNAKGVFSNRAERRNSLVLPGLVVALGTGVLPLLIAVASPTVAALSAAAALVGAIGWIFIGLREGRADDNWQRKFGRLLVVWVLGALLVGLLVGLVPVVARGLPVIGGTLIAWMFAVVWTTDVAAYFTGRAIGGPKLWPSVSPNKTWSGFCGGAVGGALAGWLVMFVGANLVDAPHMGAMGVLAVSLLASIVGQGGDLAESALKRRAGVKDSGRIIPGHGGVLDRVDSFLAVCLLVAIGLGTGAQMAQ